MAEQQHDSIWASGGPGDADLFKDPIPQEVGGRDLFTVPYEPRTPEVAEPQVSPAPEALPFPPEWTEARQGRWISLQSLLVASIMVVSFLLLYGLFLAPPPASTVAQAPSPEAPPVTTEQAPPASPVVKAHEDDTDSIVTEVPVVQDSSEPASRQVAESYFSKMDFQKAMAVYERLYQRLPSSPDHDAARDFLVWRMALCAKGQGHPEQAVTLLRQPARSRFPVVRALARYHLGLAAIQQQQYLEAMGEVYQALALSDALQGQGSWPETFKRSCRFLIAKAVTLEALSLRETQEDWPASLWTPPSFPDPWGSLDDETWSQALQSGVQALSEASLGPRVEAVTETSETGGQWKVISNGASLEELVLRIAAQAKLDLAWSVTSVSGTSTVDPATRRRPTFVCLTGAEIQDALTQVAGSARLSVLSEPSGKMALVDPLNYRSLGEHIAGLRQQAMSLWIQLRMISPDQGTVPTTHFALGLLYEQNDQATQAITEYGLLVSRFPQSSLAPQALLRSSRLRMDLRDYARARLELSQLVGQYPEAGSSAQALLVLAEATQKAGLPDEAVRLYTKTFHAGGTAESRRTAALKAGQCLFQQQQYEQALRWLTRYLDLAAKTKDQGRVEVYILLGKTNLAMTQFENAAEAFDRALRAPLERSDYMAALLGLVQARIGQDDCVGALNALDREHPRSLARKDRTDLSIVKAQVLRSMGLPERAIGLLEEGVGSIGDPNQKAQASFQLAQCHQELGHWESARRCLSQVLEVGEPGPLTQQAGLELASVLLRMEQPDKAIALCRQVLNAHPTESVRHRASDILAQAYANRQDFDKAAESLLPGPGDPKGLPVRPTHEAQGPSGEVTHAEG